MARDPRWRRNRWGPRKGERVPREGTHEGGQEEMMEERAIDEPRDGIRWIGARGLSTTNSTLHRSFCLFLSFSLRFKRGWKENGGDDARARFLQGVILLRYTNYFCFFLFFFSFFGLFTQKNVRRRWFVLLLMLTWCHKIRTKTETNTQKLMLEREGWRWWLC